MDGANVAIFEDDLDLQEGFADILNYLGHEVVLQAASLDEAERKIGSLDPATDKIDVALIDGNLSAGKIDCSDGAKVVQLLQSKLGTIPTIGISGAGHIEGVTANISKANFGEIAHFIGELSAANQRY
jgi:DNA-binding NtrC family response regulator